MLITVCKSKIHRATVTDCDLNYVGSITIDSHLMKLADLVEWEKVQIANVSTGVRFETYVIEGKANSGEITINGAAARRASKGDLIIIISYGHFDKNEVEGYQPAIVHVDSQNRPLND